VDVLRVVVVLGVVACGGTGGRASTPAPVPAEAEDVCGADAARSDDVFASFCTTHGQDVALEKQMTQLLVNGGANPQRFSLRCRASICSVKCVMAPRERCVDELHAVGAWEANAPRAVVEAMAFADQRGYALFRFSTQQELAALAKRRALVARLAHRLHDSAALESCKQSATAHGLLLLYVDVPTAGTPSVSVDGGGVAQTADADCVSKVLLAAVIDEQVTPPFSSRNLPIAVKL
jgi:hypothetical protein